MNTSQKKKKKKMAFLQSTHLILYDFPYIYIYIYIYIYMCVCVCVNPIGYILYAHKLEAFIFYSTSCLPFSLFVIIGLKFFFTP
jgi:hypothetical protein